MSNNVADWVKKNDPSMAPPSPAKQQARTVDRRNARDLKILQKKPTVNSAGISSPFTSTAPSPNTPQHFPADATNRPAYQVRHSQNHIYEDVQHGVFSESDVDSNFDMTRTTDLEFDQNQDFNGQGQGQGQEGDYGTEQQIHKDIPYNGNPGDAISKRQKANLEPVEHKRSHSAFGTGQPTRYDSSGSAKRRVTEISGRFHQGSRPHSVDVQPQASHNSAPDLHANGATKRGRQEAHTQNYYDSHPQQSVEVEAVTSQNRAPVAQSNQKVVHDDPDPKDTDDDDNFSSATESPSRQRIRPTKRKFQLGPQTENTARPATEPDFDDEVLSRMTFAEVKGQTIEHGPEAQKSSIPAHLKTASIAEKMETITSWEEEDVIFQALMEMTISEWEEAGDWFLGQFGRFVEKFKEARRNRRKVTATFEKELEDREKTLRIKSKGLDHLLGGMENDAQQLLRGASPSKP